MRNWKKTGNEELENSPAKRNWKQSGKEELETVRQRGIVQHFEKEGR
jgi:hypothetical protein